MKEQIAKSVFWIVWSKGVIQILSFLSTLAVARLLEPSDYGLIALTGIWIGTIALLAEMGLGATIIQFRDMDKAELNTCFWLNTVAAVIGYIALYTAAPSIAAWFSSPMLSEVLRVVGLSLPLASVRIVPNSLLIRMMALDKTAQAEIVTVCVSIPLVVGLAWAGAGVWALVAGMLLSALVQSLITFWLVDWRPGLKMESRRLREIVHYSLATQGSGVCWTLFDQADAFVLGKVSGDMVLGYYSMAKHLAMLPVHKIAVLANQFNFPIMAGLQSDRDRMCAAFLRGLRLVASLTVPMCIGGALMAEDLVVLALSQKWLHAAPLLQLLCLFALGHSLAVLMPPMLLARYRALFLFRRNLTLVLVMPFAFWAGAVWMGAWGVALVWVVIYPIFVAWTLAESLKELNITLRSIWDQVQLIVAATLAMGGMIVIVQWAMPGVDFSDRLGRLTLATGLGAVVYWTCISWSGSDLRSEIAEVASWLVKRGHSPNGRNNETESSSNETPQYAYRAKAGVK